MAGIQDYMPRIFAGVSAVGNMVSQWMANEQSTKLADMANQWSIEQWNRENEYNLPVNQVARMRAAGINPGLMYGQNGMMNEAASSPAVTSAAGSIRPYIMDPLTAAQVSLIDSQREKTDAETTGILQELPKKLQDYEQRWKESDQLVNKMNEEMSVMRETIQNLREERRLTIERELTESFNRMMSSAQFVETCKRNSAEIRKWAQEEEESRSRVRVNNATEADIKAATALKWQEYAYLAQANTWRLLGLQYDANNKLKMGLLYDDQHQLNDMQKTLLGFDISNGRLEARRNEHLSKLAYDGSAAGTVFGILDSMVGVMSMIASPVKGLIHIGR